MRIACGLVVLLGCGGDSGGTGGTSDASGIDTGAGGTWTTGAPVGHGAIQETAAVAINGKIYLIGGFEGSTIVNRVQVYDTAMNTWSDGPALPIPMHHANAATDGTSIYVLGALGNNFAPLADAYVIDPVASTQWTTLPSLPGARARGAAVTAFIAGRIYVAGGFRNFAASDLVDIYDTTTEMWSQGAPVPAARDHACGGAIGGHLVFAGGRTVQTSSPRPDVWTYDPNTNEWAARPPMPTGRGGMGCGVIDDVLYATGGEGNPASPSGVFADVEAFDPAANTWTELAPMPNPKHGVAGAVWDGALYLCGGADVEGFGAIAATDIFRP